MSVHCEACMLPPCSRISVLSAWRAAASDEVTAATAFAASDEASLPDLWLPHPKRRDPWRYTAGTPGTIPQTVFVPRIPPVALQADPVPLLRSQRYQHTTATPSSVHFEAAVALENAAQCCLLGYAGWLRDGASYLRQCNPRAFIREEPCHRVKPLLADKFVVFGIAQGFEWRSGALCG